MCKRDYLKPRLVHQECRLHTLIYTLALVFLLPNIVVISLIPDINVSAIGVKSREPLRILDMVFISPLVGLPKNQVQALLYEI